MLLAATRTAVPIGAHHEALPLATPYCGSLLNPPNSGFVYMGACASTIQSGFFSLPDNEQHDILERIRYGSKSPPRMRRCVTPIPGCSPSANPGVPTDYVWARIQAVYNGRLIHPAALPANHQPVVLARVTYLHPQGGADRDSLTGARAVADDYYLIARRDNANRARVIFLRYEQNPDGTWTRDTSNAGDGFFAKCDVDHPHIAPDVADFFECRNVPVALRSAGLIRTQYDVWRAFGRFTDSLVNARRAAGRDLDGQGEPGVFRRAAFTPAVRDEMAQTRFSPYDDGGWMTCALGCCSTQRF